MSYKNGLISIPVSVSDVKAVLGVSSCDVGSLCRSSLINIWAKYKPFNHSALDFADDADRDNALRLAHYGLAAPTATSGALIDNVMDKKWVYTDRTAPYRLGDFRKYYHNSSCPVKLVDAEYNLFHNPTVSFILQGGSNQTIDGSGNYNLQFSDVFDTNTFADYHLCMLLKGKNASGTLIKKLVMSYYRDPTTGNETGSKWSYLGQLTSDVMNTFYGDLEITLLCTNQRLDNATQINKLVDVSGVHTFYPLPYNTLSDVRCTIRQNNTFGITASLNGLKNYGSRSGQWSSADQYNPMAMQQEGTLKNYWKLRHTDGSICYSIIMRFAMTNTTDSEIRLFANKFSVSLNRTFSKSEATINQGVSAMLNDAGQVVAEIVIPAHQTVNVGLELPNGIYRGETSSPSNQSLTIQASYYYATSGVAVFTQQLNVQNY